MDHRRIYVFCFVMFGLLTACSSPSTSAAHIAEPTKTGLATATRATEAQTPRPVATNTVRPRPVNATREAEENLEAQPTASVADLSHGPVVGAVTSNSARVFVRTGRPASVRIQYSTASDLKGAKTSVAVTTQPESDFAGQVELSGLEADTPYYLNITVNDVPQLPPPYPTFKTFPIEGSAKDFKFVILTDFGWRITPIFRNAAKLAPDFVVIGGDFSHFNPNTLRYKRNMFTNKYSRYGPLPDLPNFILDHFAVAHFWDDHDYGVNNGDKNYPNKKMSLEVLKEYFPVYPLTANGDWQKFTYGNAEFFMLDSRSQRDPRKPKSKNKSMLDGDHLGKDGQYEWLVNGLLHSTAKWKFILTPVVFNPTLPKPDAWNGYLAERKKIVDFIHKNNIQGVILISGDLHAGGIDDGTNSDFPEMVVPAVNANGCLTANQPGTWSGGVYAGPHDEPCSGFGVVSVENNPPRVTLEVRNQDSDVMLQEVVESK